MTPLDLAGIGVGPFNLSLAALADGVDGLSAAFFEREPGFRWHPGMMIDGTTLQVPFLADLVSLVEPAHPLSFLSYLRAHDRLFPFYFAEKFHIPRAEYDDYCRWAARRLPCRFDSPVESVRWSDTEEAFVLDVGGERVLARSVVLGVGTGPVLPEPLRGLDRVTHSAQYLAARDRLVEADDVTVIGSGQSGAEVFLDLLRRRRGAVRWLTRTRAFAPMEYSKLGLEQFTPDYTRYFRGLAGPVRAALVPAQWQLHKAISAETIAEIHDELYRRTVGGGWPDATLAPGVEVVAATGAPDGVRLRLRHVDQGTTSSLRTTEVVCATGYAERDLSGLLGDLPAHDDEGKLVVDGDYRVALRPGVTGRLYAQNAERHTHGVGAPDLGLAAWRAATILNSVCGRVVHRLPERTAYTTFGFTGDSTTEGSAT
ncbi:lysine N(6)-hydroxylase/L-ornithine N(5)-oxygenase family protein [Actinokineospora spheciospongiae]|uniref:lysine N(6)-hydroxylase/L-ornithine N(5)-oxygenase family protein n=1 Tax=Actinokineospora spheciospongiae TaxID=909613 RepID=UPI000D70D064|nr:SidA/IucD/PvdA family monooxygenase [Actinokineospora spheciospongiae]PWW62321.1 lysine/ornithine N-monooxygenase [Actinokineospora spheciospongiae]